MPAFYIYHFLHIILFTMYILTCFSTFSANLASRQYFLIFIHYLLSSRINLIQYLPTWRRIFAPIHESCFAFSAPTTENQTLLFIAAPAGRRILSWINCVFLIFWQVYFSDSVSIFLRFPKVYFSDAQSVFLEPLLFSTAPLPGGRPILSGIGLDSTQLCASLGLVGRVPLPAAVIHLIKSPTAFLGNTKYLGAPAHTDTQVTRYPEIRILEK